MKEIKPTQAQQQKLVNWVIGSIGEKNARTIKEVISSEVLDVNKLEALSRIPVKDIYAWVKAN